MGKVLLTLILVILLGRCGYGATTDADTLWLGRPGVTNNHAAILVLDHTSIDGVPGETCTNRLTLSNASDEVATLQLRLVAPTGFRLLTTLPATLTLSPHTSRPILLKFMIDRGWNGKEGIIRLETTANATQRAPSTQSAIRFSIVPNRNAPSVLTFTLLTDAPHVVPGQDTLWVPLRFSNQGPRPRRVRIWLYALPDGFRLPRRYDLITINQLRDTTIRVPCLTTAALDRNRRYDLTLEVQEADRPDGQAGAFLGSVLCRPVLLASNKRLTDRKLLGGEAPFGVAAGVGRFGQAGLVSELRTWGQQALSNGQLRFNLHYLHYADLRYHELRDTYLHYDRPGLELHLGSLYDMHELPLIGVGIRVAATFGADRRLEAWAVRNQSNWLADLVPLNRLGTFQATQPLADHTYSVRLSGTLPFRGEARYELSSSYYHHRRLDRAGLLHYAATHWTPAPHTKLSLRVGHSYDFAPGHQTRQRLTGWAVGGSFSRHTKPLDVQASAYLSSPVYSGIQRGATLLDHSLTWKRWPNARLTYRFSQIRYHQELPAGPNELVTRHYGNTVAELYWTQQVGRLSAMVRPYWWQQVQSLPSGITQQATSGRMLASVRYQSRAGLRAEAVADVGWFAHQMPASDQFRVGSFRYLGAVGVGSVALMALYQQGPYLINDYLPGRGNPARFRQVSVGPTGYVSLLDGRLRSSLGAGLTYNSIADSWNGLLYQSSTFVANESLRFRLDLNALSYAAQFTDMTNVPWQDSQVRLEVAKTFRRLPGQAVRTLRLRFFEDENNNQRRDGSETYLPDLVVHVNQTALLTDANGQVVCKDIPRGTYTVRAVSKLKTGEPLFFQDTITVVSSVVREMGIRQTWRVAGQLHCQRARYETQPCDLEQYRVETSGAAGEGYRTYADADGRFALYLPVGTYQLSVTPVQTPANRKLITCVVPKGGSLPTLSIDLDPTSRPVQIKRFGMR